MKALEKDRTRRYESVAELAKDVQRYLNDEPVEACPPSTVYRLRKFARRNKTAMLASTAITAVLIVGAGISSWQAIRATRALYREQEARMATDGQRRRAEENLRLALDALDQVYLRFADEQAKDYLKYSRQESPSEPEVSAQDKELLQQALSFYEQFVSANRQEPMVLRETVEAFGRIANIRQLLKMEAGGGRSIWPGD